MLAAGEPLQFDAIALDPCEGPHGPAWLCRLVGDQFFQSVAVVTFEPRPGHQWIAESDATQCIQQIKRLRTVRQLIVSGLFDTRIKNKLEAALPENCELR